MHGFGPMGHSPLLQSGYPKVWPQSMMGPSEPSYVPDEGGVAWGGAPSLTLGQRNRPRPHPTHERWGARQLEPRILGPAPVLSVQFKLEMIQSSGGQVSDQPQPQPATTWRVRV